MPMLSYEDFFDIGIRSVLIRPSKFSAEQARESESTANTVMNIVASMQDETAVVLDTAISENAFGPAMRMGGTVQDRLALDRYGDDFEPRKSAPVAVVPVSFYRTGNEGCTIRRNARVASEDGTIFRTDADVIFPPNVKGPLSVFATCTIAGPNGNVGPGTITVLLDKPSADPSMTVTNDERATGGGPREEDGPFGGRIQGYWRSARKGTRGAVQYAAESVDGITSATTEEYSNPFNGKPEYRGSIVLADMNGSANQALVKRVVDALPESRGLGVPVLVVGGVPVEVSIEVAGLVFAAGTQTSELLDQLRQAIITAVNSLRPSDTLRVATIMAAIEQFAPQVKAPENAVVVPAGDLLALPGQSFKTRDDLVLINGQ